MELFRCLFIFYEMNCRSQSPIHKYCNNMQIYQGWHKVGRFKFESLGSGLNTWVWDFVANYSTIKEKICLKCNELQKVAPRASFGTHLTAMKCNRLQKKLADFEKSWQIFGRFLAQKKSGSAALFFLFKQVIQFIGSSFDLDCGSMGVNLFGELGIRMSQKVRNGINDNFSITTKCCVGMTELVQGKMLPALGIVHLAPFNSCIVGHHAIA